MDNWKCPICAEFVVETQIRDEVFGNCTYCGYSWERVLPPIEIEKFLEKV